MKKRTLKSALALALAFTMLYRMLPAAFAVEQSQLPTPEGGMMDEAALEGDSLNSFAPESGSQLEANPNTQSGQPSEEPAAGQPETGDPVSEKNSVGEPSEDPAETEQPIRNFCTVRGYVRLSDEDAPLSEDEISDLLDAEGINLKEYSDAEILQKQQELQTIRAQALGMSISDFEQAAALHRSVGAYQQELTAFEISRSHAQLSEEDGETILQLINGGYSNSQAFAANIAAGELGLSIQQLLEYKAAELAKTQNELEEDEPFALFSDPEENIQVTEEIQNPEYVKIATKLGLPYQAIEDCTAQEKAKLPQITQAFDAKLEARYPNQAAAWTEDAEESNSNLAGNAEAQDSGSVQATSSGDIDFAPQKILDKPFSYDKIADASVNLNSGEFSYQETDLSIPGVNGLDLNFTRRYRSDDSQAIQPWATIDDSGSGKAFSVGLKPYLCTRRGKIIEEIFDINDYVSYGGDSFASVFAQEYQDGYWEFPLSQSGNVFVYNFSAGEYYEAAYFKSTLEPSIYLAFDKTGSEVCVGFHPILIGISPKFENYCENSNRMADTYNKNEYGFGNGWRLGFSSIESFSVSNYYYVEEKQRLITSDGMQYIIHFTPDSTDSNLEGYKLSDIRLEQTGDGYPGASYTLFHADGKKEYFDANGRNIAIVDRYGNAITLSYTVAVDTVSKITIVDTLGHVIIYKNENIDRSVKWKENSVTYNEKWTLSLDGTVVQTYYSYNYTTSSDLDICTLAMVKNEGGEYTEYSQYSGTYKFNCFVSSPSTNDGINSYVTLSTIIYPNQEKISMLHGESPKRTLGFSGYETYYCVHSLRLEAKGASRTEYNQYTTYQYSDYTHLYAEPGKALQYSSDDYSTTVTHERLKWMDMLTAWRQTESVFTFSPGHLKLEEEQYHSEPLQDDLLNTSDDIDTSRKLVKKYVYTYNNSDLPASITETNYSSTGETGMTTALSYTYDSKGNILTQTVPDNNGGTYTTAYTYDAAYNLPLTTSYSQDAFKTIRIQNTLTADKKGIASTITTENSVQKARTDYTYNDKGQVTEEKGYIDITNFVEKQFVYGTSEAPQIRMVHQIPIPTKCPKGSMIRSSIRTSLVHRLSIHMTSLATNFPRMI